jgi:hypothetical protein
MLLVGAFGQRHTLLVSGFDATRRADRQLQQPQ